MSLKSHQKTIAEVFPIVHIYGHWSQSFKN